MPKKTDGPQEDAATTRARLLGDQIKNMKKTYKGLSPLANARDDERLIVPRVSTGLYALDVAMNGGYPICRMTLVYGDAKGGKTTMLLRGLANMQRLCGNCYKPAEFGDGVVKLPDARTGEIKEIKTQVIKNCSCGKPKDIVALWCDSEGVWLPSWAKTLGVWAEKVILMRPSFGEQGYDIITGFAQTGLIDLMVIDSLAAMTPSDELTGGMQESQPGVAARMNNKFIRKIISLMNLGFQADVGMTIWAINQFREKIGVQFGSNKTLPGGKGQLFAGTIELEFNPGKVTLDENDEPILGEFRWVVRKNKVGTSGGKGSYKQWMSDTDIFKIGDLQEHDTVIAKAVGMGMVDHPNSQTYEFDGKKFRGINHLIRYLGENPHRYDALKSEMLLKKLHLDEEYD